jgi:hypothetical protein
MSRALRYAFALSLLLNVGVVAALGYQWLGGGLPHGLEIGEQTAADYLKLSASQRERWHALEADFLLGLQSGIKEIAAHRENLIREIFSESPVPGRIEREREAIARLQDAQQKRVIGQLLEERELLDTAQRQALAELLLRQSPAESHIERLHRK